MTSRVHFAAEPRALRVRCIDGGRPIVCCVDSSRLDGAKLACEVVFDPDALGFVVKPSGEVDPQMTLRVEQVTCRACRRSPLFASTKREARWAAQPWPHSLIFYGRRYKCHGRACGREGRSCPRHPLPKPKAPVVVKRVVKMSRTRPARVQGAACPPEDPRP